MECIKWKSLTEDLFNHCLNLWGEEIEYHVATGEIYKVSGIVDLTSLMVDPQTHTTIQSIQPQVRLKSSDFKLIPQPEDKLFIRGKQYQVIEAHPDGQGTLACLLHEGQDNTS